MKSSSNSTKLVTRGDWEQVVMAEVLVPDVANVFGDFWTKESIKQAAYGFMMQGFGIDIEHDNIDVLGGKACVVESFIARSNDPDFIEGSWVVGMKILDPELWQSILDGDINGYSYEAVVLFLEAVVANSDNGMRNGVTEPSTEDGHTHYYMVQVDQNNRPISGGTSETDGHFHTIVSHTHTEEANGHTHRYNLVVGKDGK